jgi:hypothetical protein
MPELSDQDQQTLRDFRRRLIYLAAISSAIDLIIFGVGIPFLSTTLGTSLIVDELVELFISSLIAKNKMKLKNRYKIAGFIPIPGVTALTLQCLVEYRQALRQPQAILARFRDR